MKLADFDYNLPKELIARYPLKEREKARLLVLNRKDGTIKHLIFEDILRFLQRDELLVLNDTKVLPCRLKGNRVTAGKAELLLIAQKTGLTFSALIKPSRIKVGERIILNGGNVSGIVTARAEVTFSAPNTDEIYNLGKMPLPPYIKRQPEEIDDIYYQTVYAKRQGAIAAPTAGLHFTIELLDQIKSSYINIAYITLHISYSTFKPVKSQDITKHRMEGEYFDIDENAAKLIEKTRAKKARIFAVGTTSCRALETYASGKGKGCTDLFIYPGYKFKIVDCLLTNFHLPRTTLFMLVCAFAGTKLIKSAYQEAIDMKYRFYSYGDAMLII